MEVSAKCKSNGWITVLVRLAIKQFWNNGVAPRINLTDLRTSCAAMAE